MNTDDATIRQWARDNGYQVGERGRLQENVKDTFYRAHDLYCDKCSHPNYRHATWCALYGKSETVTVETVETFPTETVTADVVIPAASQPVDNTAEGTEATFAALVRSIAATAVSAAPPSLDVDAVRAIAEEVALEVVAEVAQPKVYDIHIASLPVKHMDGNLHARFEDVVKIVGAGLHAYLVGGPGTGKTTLCGQVAEALGLNFGMIPCDPTMPASKLFGFVDAGGTYRGTVFRDIYENGGVFLFDELDNAHPGIIASINGTIANRHCAFPDGMVKRDANFRCIAAANTFGTGATRQFVGRNQLDAATLDRFVTVEVAIDEVLEEALTLANCAENVAIAKEWLTLVRKWRRNVETHNLQVIISPRASIEGARLLSVGFDMAQTAEMKVWKGIDAGTREKIEGGRF